MTGFVLAGGHSSRMGRDKALLPVGSLTLIETVIERIRPLVERVVVVASLRNVGWMQERLPHEILTDVRPVGGPLMGVYTGLMRTETAMNLFVPCDMPWIEGRLIARLAGACREPDETIASLHPVEGVQPFPLLCPASACRSVGALLDQGERSLQALLRRPGARLVRIEAPDWWRSFENVNTLADYAKLCDEAPVPS